MARQLVLLFVALSVAACLNTPPPSSATPPEGNDEASVSATPFDSLDAALVESHEAACQANDAAYVALGAVPRGWPASNGSPSSRHSTIRVHLYAEQGLRFAICYASVPGEVRIGSDVWPEEFLPRATSLR